MKHKPVRFTGEQARWISKGFRGASQEAGYRVLALAILPDHAHVLMSNHTRHVDSIARHLKAQATRSLSGIGLHPFQSHPSGKRPSPWARKYWCPFVDSESYLCDAIDYVKNNPVKAGLRPQRWGWVERMNA